MHTGLLIPTRSQYRSLSLSLNCQIIQFQHRHNIEDIDIVEDIVWPSVSCCWKGYAQQSVLAFLCLPFVLETFERSSMSMCWWYTFQPSHLQPNVLGVGGQLWTNKAVDANQFAVDCSGDGTNLKCKDVRGENIYIDDHDHNIDIV